MGTSKKPRTGPLVLLVAIGAGFSGYMVGRFQGPSQATSRTVTEGFRPEAPPAPETFDWTDREAPADDVMPVPQPSQEAGEAVTPSELLESLRRNAGSARSQKILVGMVADAARIGSAMMPEIEELLASGVDIDFPSFDGKTGYPSLRVALLAAAEATGDEGAKDLIAEVARTSENPVEVVFGAHMLDRLDALDPQTAQRTLDSLTTELTPDQKKAMASVLKQVVPAAARADPDYAEHFLATQMRKSEGPRADARTLSAVLDGLPAESARNMVLNTITAPDIHDRVKRSMAGRAASRSEIEVLSGLRQAIESNALDPRVTSSIARGAMSGKPYSQMYKQARVAMKKGNLSKASGVTRLYEARLQEALATVRAAEASGAKLPADIRTHATLYRQRLDRVRIELDKAYRKAEKAKKNQ